jgi:hypothetical protein
MPEGSSSAAPVVKPGPKASQNLPAPLSGASTAFFKPLPKPEFPPVWAACEGVEPLLGFCVGFVGTSSPLLVILYHILWGLTAIFSFGILKRMNLILHFKFAYFNPIPK